MAAATGCFVLGSTLVFGSGGTLAEPLLLVVGAIVQPHSARPGKWLMWVSAFLMSAWMYQIDAVLLREAIKQGHISLTVVAIFLAPALALWCDIALVVAAVMRKRWHELNLPHSRGNLDWVVWLAALALTAYYVKISMPYRYDGRLDITGIAFTSIALLFDVALVIQAVKRRNSIGE